MNRRAFTLLEVLVAIAVTGMVALMSHQLVQVTLTSMSELTKAQQRTEYDANARAWLRSMLLSLEVGDSAGSFDGRADRLEASSWIQQPHGWLERRRITLAVRDHALMAMGIAEEPLTLADSVDALSFDYLLEPGANTRWVQQWQSPVSMPLGVRLRLSRGTRADTLLFLIKERG